MSSWLPYGRHKVDEDDIAAVIEVLRSDWLTTGPTVERFEQTLAQRVGARYAVVVNSGTAALHAAYYAAGVGPGDEVITSPITFAATANAALYLGARPVFADVTEDTVNIDPEAIKGLVSERTKVIAPVDFAGHPADLREIMEIARDHRVVVVEDACHALGSVYRNQPVGSIADMTVFSFHPVKHITTGEGGAVVTNDPVYRDRLKLFRNHGITREPKDADSDEPWHYEMQELGFNYRLSDIQCALGISQLQKLDGFLRKRRALVELYNRSLTDRRFVRPTERGESNSAWHLYILRVRNQEERRGLVQYLHRNGIGAQVHYLPVYRHPYYLRSGYADTICPKAEAYYHTCLSLPLHPSLSEEALERVVNAVIDGIRILRIDNTK